MLQLYTCYVVTNWVLDVDLSLCCVYEAYCVVAVEAIGRQVPIAFLERIKEDFTKKYGDGKAVTTIANTLNI